MHKSLQAESKLRVNKMRAGSCVNPTNFSYGVQVRQWEEGSVLHSGVLTAAPGCFPTGLWAKFSCCLCLPARIFSVKYAKAKGGSSVIVAIISWLTLK